MASHMDRTDPEGLFRGHIGGVTPREPPNAKASKGPVAIPTWEIQCSLPTGAPTASPGSRSKGADGDNLVHLFAQWGLEQLILAIVAWVVIVRYRFLIPFVLLLQLFDWLMRGVMGEIKPLVVNSMPPGGIGNIIFVPLVAVALWLSLPKVDDRTHN